MTTRMNLICDELDHVNQIRRINEMWTILTKHNTWMRFVDMGEIIHVDAI
jgi:hypothetical protein